jgi:hypothetical protein
MLKNFTNINKINNHLSPWLTEHKKRHIDMMLEIQVLVWLWDMQKIVTYSVTCLNRHAKVTGKCVRLYKFYFSYQKYFGTIKFCRMSQDVGKLRCQIAQVPLYIYLHVLICYCVFILYFIFKIITCK